MIQVTQSPFLQALGYAIINSLWQFALLWLLYILISSIGKMSSHKRFVTGVAFLTSGFAWFIFTLLFYYKHSVAFAGAVSDLPANYVSDFSAAESGSMKEWLLAYLVHAEQFLPYFYSIPFIAGISLHQVDAIVPLYQ